MANVVVCQFKLDEETKGAVRYSQATENGQPVGDKPDDKLIGTIYLRKAKLSKPFPATFSVTLEM